MDAHGMATKRRAKEIFFGLSYMAPKRDVKRSRLYTTSTTASLPALPPLECTKLEPFIIARTCIRVKPPKDTWVILGHFGLFVIKRSTTSKKGGQEENVGSKRRKEGGVSYVSIALDRLPHCIKHHEPLASCRQALQPHLHGQHTRQEKGVSRVSRVSRVTNKAGRRSGTGGEDGTEAFLSEGKGGSYSLPCGCCGRATCVRPRAMQTAAGVSRPEATRRHRPRPLARLFLGKGRGKGGMSVGAKPMEGYGHHHHRRRHHYNQHPIHHHHHHHHHAIHHHPIHHHHHDHHPPRSPPPLPPTHHHSPLAHTQKARARVGAGVGAHPGARKRGTSVTRSRRRRVVRTRGTRARIGRRRPRTRVRGRRQKQHLQIAAPRSGPP